MKAIVREIITTPVILVSIGLMLSIYGLILSASIRKNEQVWKLAENLSVRFLILCQSELSLTPFVHWSTLYLVVPPLNTTIAYFQAMIYFYIIFTFFPKIKNFVQFHLSKALAYSTVKNPFFWTLSFLVLVSFIWSDTPFIAFRSGVVLLAINLVGLYIATQFNWDEIFSFARWNLGLIALLSFVIRRRTNAGTTEGGGGLAGVLPSKNTLGGLMALGATLWILYGFSNPKRRPFSVFMSFVCLLILAQAKSGGAYFLFIILVFIAFSSRFLKVFRSKHFVMATATLLVLTILSSILILFNAERILGAVGKDLSFTGRSLVWPAVLQAATKRIWLGYGMFSFWQPWRGVDNPAIIHWTANKHWIPPSAHQGFLDVLLQLGVIGLTVMIFNLLVNFMQGVKYLAKGKGLPAIFPLIVILHHFLSNLPETRFLRPNAFWVIYAIVAIKLSLAAQPEVSCDRHSNNNKLLSSTQRGYLID